MKMSKRQIIIMISMVCVLLFCSLILTMNDYTNMTIWGYIKVVSSIIAILAGAVTIIGLLLHIRKNSGIGKDA